MEKYSGAASRRSDPARPHRPAFLQPLTPRGGRNSTSRPAAGEEGARPGKGRPKPLASDGESSSSSSSSSLSSTSSLIAQRKTVPKGLSAPAAPAAPAPDRCAECRRKDATIDQLRDQIEELQMLLEELCAEGDPRIPPPQQPQQRDEVFRNGDDEEGRDREPTNEYVAKMDLVLRNIAELNGLVHENARSIARREDSRGASFERQPVVAIAFFANGFHLDTPLSRFRPYGEAASKVFMQDLTDGFFPAEMQGHFPSGVTLLASDRRTELGPARKQSEAFSGTGRMLDSRLGRRPVVYPTSGKQKPTSRNLGSRARQLAPLAPFGRASSNRDKCLVKVMGVGDAHLLLELVAYDTVKTLRAILANCVRARSGAGMEQSEEGECSIVEIYLPFPRTLVRDNALTLADLSLAPSAVVHVVVVAARGAASKRR